jgi:hypothetical protein
MLLKMLTYETNQVIQNPVEESANAQLDIYLPLLDERAYVSISVYDNCSIDIAFL